MYRVIDPETRFAASLDHDGWFTIYYEKFVSFAKNISKESPEKEKIEAVLRVARWTRALADFSFEFLSEEDEDYEEVYAVGRLVVEVIDWINYMHVSPKAMQSARDIIFDDDPCIDMDNDVLYGDPKTPDII